MRTSRQNRLRSATRRPSCWRKVGARPCSRNSATKSGSSTGAERQNVITRTGLLSHILIYAGEAEEGVEIAIQGMRLGSRFDVSKLDASRRRPALQGRSEEAIEDLKRSVELRPDFVPGFVWLASTDGNMGRQAELKQRLHRSHHSTPTSRSRPMEGRCPIGMKQSWSSSAKASRSRPAGGRSALGAALISLKNPLCAPNCYDCVALSARGKHRCRLSRLRFLKVEVDFRIAASRVGSAKCSLAPLVGSMVLRWFAAAIMLAAALCAWAADAEIRIGVGGPMTGANAWFGEQYQRGTELAVEDLNANGESSAEASS